MNEWMNKYMKKYRNLIPISHLLLFFPLLLQRESARMRLLISYWIICLELSLNTCLQMTYRKTEMETSREWLEQDGMVVLGHATSRCRSSLFAMSFFLHVGSKNVIHFKAQRKCWPHAEQLGEAGIWCNDFKYKANGCDDQTLKSQLWMSQKWKPPCGGHHSYCATPSSTSTWPSASRANFIIKAIKGHHVISYNSIV